VELAEMIRLGVFDVRILPELRPLGTLTPDIDEVDREPPTGGALDKPETIEGSDPLGADTAGGWGSEDSSLRG
jgi:hypothetical protein